jgi:hypothetical protein
MIWSLRVSRISGISGEVLDAHRAVADHHLLGGTVLGSVAEAVECHVGVAASVDGENWVAGHAVMPVDFLLIVAE